MTTNTDPAEMDPDPWEQLSRQEKEEYEVWSELVEEQFKAVIGGKDERQRNQSA